MTQTYDGALCRWRKKKVLNALFKDMFLLCKEITNVPWR
jgi:hypothetical protein